MHAAAELMERPEVGEGEEPFPAFILEDAQ
jgi:hypothetical protein